MKIIDCLKAAPIEGDAGVSFKARTQGVDMRATRLEPVGQSGLTPQASPPPVPSPIAFRTADAPECTGETKLKGYFVTRNGKSFAGSHLIIDLRNAKRLDDIDHIEQTLVEAVNAAGATLLHIHLHHFSPGGGVSGVAVLSESHISIHTWPEHGFAALDVFMCGDCNPHDTVPVLQRAFEPETVELQDILRGEVRVANS
jgi:S-adenosylmethionine decarboxylase